MQEVEASAVDGLKGNLETFSDVWDRSHFIFLYYI